MKRFISVIAVILALLAASCSRKVEASYTSIPLVDALVADSLQSLQILVRESGKPSGSIALIGEPRLCLALGEKMMGSDEFDNVDGKSSKDGLPDFSGETIVPVLDFANYPYDSLSSAMDLREVAVRNAIEALDSASRCKVLIICSPKLVSCGAGEDIVDFFGKIGCDVPVIFSADTAFSYTQACYKTLRERNLFTHNIAWPAARILMTVKDSSNPPFSAVSFDDDLVPVAFTDTVGVLAPNTYVSYVQNKH